MKQRDVLLLLLFDFAPEYVIGKVQGANLGLDRNGSPWVLTYADDVNLIGNDIKRNANVLLNACEDIGLAVNTGETKYLEIGFHRA